MHDVINLRGFRRNNYVLANGVEGKILDDPALGSSFVEFLPGLMPPTVEYGAIHKGDYPGVKHSFPIWKSFEPIPLTPEWLNDLGFAQDAEAPHHWVLENRPDNAGDFFPKRRPLINNTAVEMAEQGLYSFYIVDAEFDPVDPHFQHVHELQNYYQDKTGQWLTLKTIPQ